MQVPNFHKLSAISLMAAVMSISYSTIAIGVSAHAGRQPDAKYNLDGFTKADGIFGIFNALGTIAFAYGGHNVVLEIQVEHSFNLQHMLAEACTSPLLQCFQTLNPYLQDLQSKPFTNLQQQVAHDSNKLQHLWCMHLAKDSFG